MAEREPPGYPYGGPAGALPVFGRGLNVKAGYLKRWIVMAGMAGWEAPCGPCGARGSAARFPAMTLANGPTFKE
jgi:hypothetical protein